MSVVPIFIFNVDDSYSGFRTAFLIFSISGWIATMIKLALVLLNLITFRILNLLPWILIVI